MRPLKVTRWRAVAHPVGERRQLRAFELEPRREELPHDDGIAVESRAAHEERLRAGAACKAGGFEVDGAEAVERAGAAAAGVVTRAAGHARRARRAL